MLFDVTLPGACVVAALFDVKSFKDTGEPTLRILIVHGVFLYNTVLLPVNVLIDATESNTPVTGKIISTRLPQHSGSTQPLFPIALRQIRSPLLAFTIKRLTTLPSS